MAVCGDVHLIRCGQALVNLVAVASAHWDTAKGVRTLFVYYIGGRFTQHVGEDADKLWQELSEHAVDTMA